MRNLQNIEKSAFRVGEYIGHGGGSVWHITKASTSYGRWAAHDREDYNRQLFAFTLAKLSEKLASLEINQNGGFNHVK